MNIMKFKTLFWRTNNRNLFVTRELFIQGFMHVLDGMTLIFSLGFFCSSFAVKWAGHCMHQNIKRLEKEELTSA